MIRSGSFLLLAIVLIAVLVALTYALLQTIRLSADAGTSSQRAWLAQEAAVAGTTHAMENILAEFRTPNQPTFLDGRWHRDFYALGRDRNQPGSATVPGADDDTRDEYPIWGPLGFGDADHGHLYPPRGKARYYEVDYLDPDDRTAARFTNAAAPLPPRHGALFLDNQLRLIEPVGVEDAAAVRARARYRLRYAVVVNDTSSNILINPALDVDYRDAWLPGQPALTWAELPADDPYKSAHYAARFGAERIFAPTALGRRIERYGNSLYNLLHAAPNKGNHEASIPRLVHVFSLRGSANNAARDAAGWPATFPTMYRAWTSTTTSRRNQFGVSNPDQGLGLYVNQDNEVALEGGKPIRSITVSNDEGPVSHVIVGPQFSFHNVVRAAAGNSRDVNISGYATYGYHRDQQMGLVTPFGRAGERGLPTQPGHWNRGPSDVPWVVNALTAPSAVTCAMIAGYLPPAMSGVQLTVENYYCFTGVNASGQDTFSGSTQTITLSPAQAKSVETRRGRDLFTDFMSPAFAQWPAPWEYPKLPDGTDNTLNPRLWPNSFINDLRPANEVYPGPYASLATRTPDAAKLGLEDTGKDIDADTLYGNGWDSHSERPLVLDVSGSETRARGGDIAHTISDYRDWNLSRSDNRTGPIETPMPTATPGTPGTWGYHPKDYIKTTPDPTVYVFQDSFFRDMTKAFATAVSVLRAHWVQVPNTWMHPVDSFPAGKLAQADVDSIEDLDRLFLRQLGIDKNNPASATVLSSWQLSTTADGLPRTFTADGITLANNIRSLVTADLLATTTPTVLTSVQRARAMEMMLNDWRMSFLGASPDYVADFRPLDFDGDTWAICSGYSSLSAFGDDAPGVTWPRQPAVGGIGPSPDIYFSLTGCFTIGKSRYYRILTRGELWDNLSRRPVSTATLESVVAIDADGTGVPSATPATATGLNDLTVLYQRWYWNRYNGLMPTVYP